MPRTFEPIASTTLSSSAASVTVNISSSAYTDIRVVICGLTSATGGSYVTEVNGASGPSIPNKGITGSNSTSTVFSHTTLYGSNSMYSSNTYYATFIFDMFDYNGGGSFRPSLIGRTSGVTGSAGQSNTAFTGGNSSAATAFTSIRFREWTGGSLAAGTVVTIFGIKAA